MSDVAFIMKKHPKRYTYSIFGCEDLCFINIDNVKNKENLLDMAGSIKRLEEKLEKLEEYLDLEIKYESGWKVNKKDEE